MSVQVGDTVRLLDRSGDVRGTVVEISTQPYRFMHPVKVELKAGRADSVFWFGYDEIDVLGRKRGNAHHD